MKSFLLEICNGEILCFPEEVELGRTTLVLSSTAMEPNLELSEINSALTVLPVLLEQFWPLHSLRACTYGDILFAAPILDFPASATCFLEVGIYARGPGLSW